MQLIKSMLHFDPAKRIKLKDVMNKLRKGIEPNKSLTIIPQDVGVLEDKNLPPLDTQNFANQKLLSNTKSQEDIQKFIRNKLHQKRTLVQAGLKEISPQKSEENKKNRKIKGFALK